MNHETVSPVIDAPPGSGAHADEDLAAQAHRLAEAKGPSPMHAHTGFHAPSLGAAYAGAAAIYAEAEAQGSNILGLTINPNEEKPGAFVVVVAFAPNGAAWDPGVFGSVAASSFAGQVAGARIRLAGASRGARGMLQSVLEETAEARAEMRQKVVRWSKEHLGGLLPITSGRAEAPKELPPKGPDAP